MVQQALEDGRATAGPSTDQERPLRGYAVLMGVFASLAGAFSLWLRSTGRKLPERVDPGDLAVLTVATHKASRLLTKDKVTSTVRAPFTRFQANEGAGEVSEAARGTGVRRALGELLVCPYCVAMWIAAGFAAGLVVAPRATRLAASVLTILFGSDLLQIAYRKAEDTL
ncbi:MAG TPA: DUF1360 domain-containing protein [Solirubrobacteraceae bacterium]|jgi:hypothetical protein|nr:DUF1360 domain-containing protein [Solirubrobacteraceae bacterium]